MKPYYQDDSATIFLGDCRDILPNLPQGSHIITDPPYSEEVHTRARSNRGDEKRAIDFDSTTSDELRRILILALPKRWFIATLDEHHIHDYRSAPPAGYEFVRMGVWVKTNPMPQLTADRPAHGWEGICYMHNSETKKRWNGGGSHGNYVGPLCSNGDHPTGKPIHLIEKFVRDFTEKGELIIDPFTGSGTTLLAAKNYGRHSIGIERDERYCEIAAKRLQQGVIEF